jgi:asparagine synthase (glutamine-hydrolysing)
MRRKTPLREWSETPLAGFLATPALAEAEAFLAYRRRHAPAFFFEPGQRGDFGPCFAQWDAINSPVALVENLARGTLRYFAKVEGAAGFPPDWHRNCFSGERAPAHLHWSEINEFQFGDIKVIWEPSRFGFAYDLVRAYWRTGDERYPQMFWQLVEDWADQNPPHAGVNWKCGQEIALRVMAWLFGLYGFLESPVTTAARVATLAQMVAVSGMRIEANLDYALSQRNNHGISEGVGLWTIGLQFPEFKQSCRWVDLGRQVLEQSAGDLIYADGSFAQHSVNYHRLMLHDYLWALRLGEIHGQPFSSRLRERVYLAWNWLFQIQDEVTGRVPNYGHNDGALVLPLNNCDYRDFRPVLQAVHYFCTGSRNYPPGPWDEDLLWLFGAEALTSNPPVHPERTALQADQGGYYTLRSRDGFAVVRCATFLHRPAQADMLHLDLWWRGQNVALDAGTYSYNAPAPWNNSLAHTACHNTVTVDGLDQMTRAGRFLWLPWLKSRLIRCDPGAAGSLGHWEGEHDGYERLKPPVSYRRAILQLADELWVVLDKLSSTASHRYRLHWLLLDVPYEWDAGLGRLVLQTEAGPFAVQVGAAAEKWHASLVRADPASARGWHSPYYNYREPALSLAVSGESPACLFWSVLGANAAICLDAVMSHPEVAKVIKRLSA